jgi:hypothetical protein
LPAVHAGIFDKAIGAAMGKKTPTTIAPYDFAADPATQASTFVEVARGDKFKDIKKLGIEVVPFETLKATKNYANIKPAQHDSPWATDTKDTQSVFMAPTGMPLYLDNPERADFLKGLGFTFGTNTRMKEVMMVYDLKQEVHLVSVNMVVDFATVSSSGNSFSSYAAKTEATDVHHLHAGDTSYRFVSNTQPRRSCSSVRYSVRYNSSNHRC